MSGTEEEDPAEYVDGHEDVGELLDPLVDGTEADEMTKAKNKELHRPEFGVYETVDIPVGLGKRGTTRWESDHRKHGIRARFVARKFQGAETMHEGSAPSSNSKHRTHHRLREPQEVVSHIHCRCDQRARPRGPTG